MRTFAALGMVVGVLAAAGSVRAQPAVTASEAAARTQAVMGAVDPAVICLQDKQRQLRRNLELIREAEAQRTAAGASAAARRDAEETLRALAERADQLQREASGCWGATTVASRTTATRTPGGATVVTTTARSTTTTTAAPGVPAGARTTTTRDAQGREVIVVEPPPDPAADSVARNAPAIAVVDRDSQLTPSIRIEVAERVDGEARIESGEVAASFRRSAPRFDACYHELVRRGGQRTGSATVAFTVTSTGRIRSAAVESATLGDSTFTSCMRSALSSLRVPAARGDYATFSYTLRFGQ
jgi:hypothetical protein